LSPRKIIHSTSLRATGSETVASIRLASSAPLLRRLSIALLTSATSASEVCVCACPMGIVDGWDEPLRASQAPDAGAETANESLVPSRVAGDCAATGWMHASRPAHASVATASQSRRVKCTDLLNPFSSAWGRVTERVNPRRLIGPYAKAEIEHHRTISSTDQRATQSCGRQLQPAEGSPGDR
jgi:hypothetical protein